MNFVNFVVVTELANSTFLVLNIERKRLLLIFFFIFIFLFLCLIKPYEIKEDHRKVLKSKN